MERTLFLDGMFYLVKYVHSALGRIKSAATSAQPTHGHVGVWHGSASKPGRGVGAGAEFDSCAAVISCAREAICRACKAGNEPWRYTN